MPELDGTCPIMLRRTILSEGVPQLLAPLPGVARPASGGCDRAGLCRRCLRDRPLFPGSPSQLRRVPNRPHLRNRSRKGGCRKARASERGTSQVELLTRAVVSYRRVDDDDMRY
jgi:hypothetical protein